MNQNVNDLKAYNAHKARAKRRRIPFEFSYEQWKTMWDNSDKKRGRASDEYCMARHNDIGSYSVDNVSIITNRENSQFAVSHRNHDKWKSSIIKSRQDLVWRQKISHEGNNQYKGPIVGTNKLTGALITLRGKNEINDAGFMHQHVYKCVNGKLKSHKGYTWQRLTQ